MKQVRILMASLLVMVLAFGMTSCSDDLLGADEITSATGGGGDDASSEMGECFDLVFPLSITYPDETTVEVGSAEKLKELRDAWRDEVLGEDAGRKRLPRDQRLHFVFPIDISQDGETQTLESKEDLGALLKECRPRGRKGHGRRGRHRGGKCAKIVFPVTVVMPDDSEITATSKEDMKEQIDAWKDANGELSERPEFVYPVTLMLKDSTEVIANDREELKEAMTSCKSERRQRCFKPVFPLSVTMPDDSVISADTPQDLRTQVKAWVEANGELSEKPAFVFPITVELKDDTTQEISSQAELDALKESCQGE